MCLRPERHLTDVFASGPLPVCLCWRRLCAVGFPSFQSGPLLGARMCPEARTPLNGRVCFRWASGFPCLCCPLCCFDFVCSCFFLTALMSFCPSPFIVLIFSITRWVVFWSFVLFVPSVAVCSYVYVVVFVVCVCVCCLFVCSFVCPFVRSCVRPSVRPSVHSLVRCVLFCFVLCRLVLLGFDLFVTPLLFCVLFVLFVTRVWCWFCLLFFVSWSLCLLCCFVCFSCLCWLSRCFCDVFILSCSLCVFCSPSFLLLFVYHVVFVWFHSLVVVAPLLLFICLLSFLLWCWFVWLLFVCFCHFCLFCIVCHDLVVV